MDTKILYGKFNGTKYVREGFGGGLDGDLSIGESIHECIAHESLLSGNNMNQGVVELERVV